MENSDRLTLGKTEPFSLTNEKMSKTDQSEAGTGPTSNEDEHD